MEFPERVFTEEEVEQARALIERGHKHKLQVTGSKDFKKKMTEVLDLIETAEYSDLIVTYIREIKEIEGLSQLHETDAAIWANMPLLTDTVDAASFIVQKAHQMKDYIERKPYYGTAETAEIEKRLEFLRILRDKSQSKEVKQKCDELLKRWEETRTMFP